MIIRVDSIENLTKNVANCLNTSVSQMLHDIRSIDFRMNSERGLDYIASHRHEKLTSVYMCHLTRRLNESSGNLLLPLDKLLLTQNAFSDFLIENDIFFQKDQNGKIALFHHKQKIDWMNDTNEVFNSRRFSNRLNGDFCVNGFQFLYDINRNASSYYQYLNAPEFIQDLDYLLNIELVQKYREKSSGFVALCKLPCDEIVFDCSGQNSDFDAQYLNSALRFIWEYNYAKNALGINPILRALDQSSVVVEEWISEEEIQIIN